MAGGTPGPKRGSIGVAAFWMFLISLLLFWLPVIGPLIAGIIGGRKAGGVGHAIVAAFLPALVFGVALFLLASILTGLPYLGVFAAAGGFILAIAHIGPLLLGAIIGGAVG